MAATAKPRRPDERIDTSEFDVPVGIPVEGGEDGRSPRIAQSRRVGSSKRAMTPAGVAKAGRAPKAKSNKSSGVRAAKTAARNAGNGKSKSKPEKISIRSYQVGFGDCFLLSFQ